jgi:YD repeat-containing protein
MSNDEVGNQVAQIDALNRTNRFEFDGLGRRTKRTLAGNQSETLGYDAVGNVVRHTNFNGVVLTNQYDALNRLTNRSSTGGYEVKWTYTATGQRATMTDGSGASGYVYDVRDRLRTNTTPQGTLRYTYDAAGNQTVVISDTAGGVSVSYQYDALNRLTNVVDGRLSGTQNTRYEFDAVGNLSGYAYPNGVTNLYQYDALNRLTNLTWKSGAAARAEFAYQLGLAGNRTNLAETINAVSRSFAWQYDALYRLTNETVSGTSPTGGVGYGLDDVGNRTNRSSSLSGVANQSLSYGVNDWLTSDTYDSNGNTTVSGPNSYQYDVENRLTNANSGAVLIVYNGDGHSIWFLSCERVSVGFRCATRFPEGYASHATVSANSSLQPTTVGIRQLMAANVRQGTHSTDLSNGPVAELRPFLQR